VFNKLKNDSPLSDDQSVRKYDSVLQNTLYALIIINYIKLYAA